MMNIKNVEQYDGQIKIHIKTASLTDIHLYIDTNESVLTGMFKKFDEDDFIDLPKQEIKESEEEWRI